MRTAVLLLLSISSAACWQPRYFMPREHRGGTSPDGDMAAMYTFSATEPPAAGEVRVWSAGAEARWADDDTEVIDLHVGFEVENNGSVAVALDPASVVCQDLYVDGLLQGPLLPHEVRGSGVAEPGETARVDFVFRPVADVPRDVESFAVRFAVHAGETPLLTQVTPFGPARRRYAGAYDPWLDGYYGGPYSAWGWGWGWGGFWGPGFGWRSRYYWR